MVVDGEPIPADDVVDVHHAEHRRRRGDRRELLRGDDGDGVRLFRARAAPTSRSSRPGSADGSTRRTSSMPLVAGVTSIGFDHTEYLGDDARGDRAREGGHLQAGTARGDRRARSAHSRAARRACARAPARRACASSPTRSTLDDVRVDDDGTTCDLEWRGERATIRTPLAGRHQAANLAFSLVMLDAAGDAVRDVRSTRRDEHIERVRIPGRFQHVGKFIFDVAHNPAGAEVSRKPSRRSRRRRRSPSCSACCATRIGAR